MAKRHGTDGSLLRSLPWTVAAVSFAVLPHTPFLPIWVTLVFGSCAGLRLLIERKRWRLPPAWIRLVLAVVSFIGVLGSYNNTISGVGPGSALLAVMAALKFMETRQRRDQFVLLFISVFLIMSSLLREQYVWSLPYLAAGVLLTTTAWLQMSISRDGSSAHAFRNSARMLLYATPLMLAMWVFFPRLATPLWAVPIDTSSGVTGLSDRVSPGDISSLAASNAVAFRAEFADTVPEGRDRYWRGLVLSRFSGRAWTSSEPSPVARGRWPIEFRGEPVRYNVTMEPTKQRWVPILDVPYEWSLEQTFMGQQQQLFRAQPIDQRVSFEAVSYPDARSLPELNPLYRNYYLRLPDGSNPETRRYGERLRAQYSDDRELIQAVLRRFTEEEYYYTLQPPQLGRNSVDQFLFDTQRGFCEHFASAFAVIMRSAGIPARVVVGYQGGELNPMSDYWIVRQSDAHAWNEVWIEGDGWTRFDPTGAVAPERIDQGMAASVLSGIGASWGFSAPTQLIYQITYAWDLVNAKWNEWILAYGPENQTSLMRWLGMDDPQAHKMLLALIAIVAAMLATITVMLMLRFRTPPRDEAAQLYAKFVKRAGLPALPGEAPLGYAARLRTQLNADASVAAERVTEQYLHLRYGTQGNVDALKEALRRYAAVAAR